jgi:hypothetical protein
VPNLPECAGADANDKRLSSPLLQRLHHHFPSLRVRTPSHTITHHYTIYHTHRALPLSHPHSPSLCLSVIEKRNAQRVGKPARAAARFAQTQPLTSL